MILVSLTNIHFWPKKSNNLSLHPSSNASFINPYLWFLHSAIKINTRKDQKGLFLTFYNQNKLLASFQEVGLQWGEQFTLWGAPADGCFSEKLNSKKAIKEIYFAQSIFNELLVHNNFIMHWWSWIHTVPYIKILLGISSHHASVKMAASMDSHDCLLNLKKILNFGMWLSRYIFLNAAEWKNKYVWMIQHLHLSSYLFGVFYNLDQTANATDCVYKHWWLSCHNHT